MLARQIYSKAAAVLAGFLMIFAGLSADAQGYRIKPGDTLQVEVLEDPSLNRSVLVLPDGSISFPFVGTLQVGGFGVSDLRRALTTGLTPNFATQPNVVVSVASVADRPVVSAGPYVAPTIDVYIMGEVANAGKRAVKPGTTILQFVAESGGLTPFAAGSRIELHRTDRTTGRTHVYLFSYNGKGRGKRIRPGTMLAPGDVVIVPARHLFE